MWKSDTEMWTKQAVNKKAGVIHNLSTSYPQVIHTEKGVIHTLLWKSFGPVEHPGLLQNQKQCCKCGPAESVSLGKQPENFMPRYFLIV